MITLFILFTVSNCEAIIYSALVIYLAFFFVAVLLLFGSVNKILLVVGVFFFIFGNLAVVIY